MLPALETDRDDLRHCGSYYRGLRCTETIPRNRTGPDMICPRCEHELLRRILSIPARRSALVDQLLQADIDEARQRREFVERTARATGLPKPDAKRSSVRQDTPAHVVYYARTGENQIKIGTTGDLPRRMREFRLVNPANVLAAEPGGYKLERQRHDEFKAERWKKRAEDFTDSPALLLHIEITREEHGDPYALAARLLAESEGRGLQSA